MAKSKKKTGQTAELAHQASEQHGERLRQLAMKALLERPEVQGALKEVLDNPATAHKARYKLMSALQSVQILEIVDIIKNLDPSNEIPENIWKFIADLFPKRQDIAIAGEVKTLRFDVTGMSDEEIDRTLRLLEARKSPAELS